MSAPDLFIPLIDRQVLSVEQTAAVLGVHRSTIFELLKAGSLTSLKIGRRRLIPRAAIDDFVARATGSLWDHHSGVNGAEDE